MRIIHIDLDLKGPETLGPLIQQGLVQSFPCPSFAEAEAVLWGLIRKQVVGDLVVVDTYTTLAQYARQDVVMDYAQAKKTPIWDNRERLVASKQDYYKTSDVVNRFSRPLRELPIPSIFVCHERTTRGMESRLDPLTGLDKYIPNLQREINEDLFTRASAIVRYHPNPYPFDLNGQQVPMGARMLVLSPTGDSTAGVNVPIGAPPPPPFLIVAEYDLYAFSRFIQAIGGAIPHNTILYGPPKAGKTYLIGTAAYHNA